MRTEDSVKLFAFYIALLYIFYNIQDSVFIFLSFSPRLSVYFCNCFLTHNLLFLPPSLLIDNTRLYLSCTCYSPYKLNPPSERSNIPLDLNILFTATSHFGTISLVSISKFLLFYIFESRLASISLISAAGVTRIYRLV